MSVRSWEEEDPFRSPVCEHWDLKRCDDQVRAGREDPTHLAELVRPAPTTSSRCSQYQWMRKKMGNDLYFLSLFGLKKTFFSTCSIFDANSGPSSDTALHYFEFASSHKRDPHFIEKSRKFIWVAWYGIRVQLLTPQNLFF